jgi:hypothetical protein
VHETLRLSAIEEQGRRIETGEWTVSVDFDGVCRASFVTSCTLRCEGEHWHVT